MEVVKITIMRYCCILLYQATNGFHRAFCYINSNKNISYIHSSFWKRKILLFVYLVETQELSLVLQQIFSHFQFLGLQPLHCQIPLSMFLPFDSNFLKLQAHIYREKESTKKNPWGKTQIINVESIFNHIL